MSKILIVGAASGLGASLAASLLQNTQHTLVTVDDLRVERDLRNLHFALSHKRGERHKFYLTQMSDPHITRKLFELERPSQVVFCKTPERSTYHQSLVRTIASAKEFGAHVLYLVPDSWSEDRNESYRYGVEICKSDSNMDTTSILRTCRIYGPRQEDGDPLTAAMGRIIASKWPNTEAASNTPREWLYIKDLLSSAELLLNSGSMSGEYFAASGRVASEYEIMMGLQRISEGLPIDIAKHEFTPANCDRLQAMGWNSKYELREALEHTLSWHAVNTWASNEARNE